jgi:Heparinase II/III-like protein/Heparinase II/III N-terminus
MRIELGEWKSRYRRVLAMSSTELSDRVRQQATARLDFLRYKAGMSFESRLRGSGQQRGNSHFFFAREDVPHLCSRLREIFPAESNQIIQRARRICLHRFDLLGYRDLDYGADIDWHCDRVHGKRSALKPWFKIRYLDFAEAGDSKVTWELNRHQHLVTLAKAFRLTGDESLATELFHQWNHWHRENPYPLGINWASSLEVAFRTLSWSWVYFLMLGSAAMPEGFRDELCRSLAVSCRHVEKYLSTYFSPNTHLLGEGVALFFIGTLFPELHGADRWQALGWKIVLDAAQHQVREDGLYFERSTYYHVWALDLFLHSSVLASRNGIAIPATFNRTLEQMLEALCVLGRSGAPPRLGDDDGGRLFDPQRNRPAHLLDPLAAGAVLFSRGDFKRVASGPREEMLWLLGEAGITEFNRLVPLPFARNSTSFQQSGLYVMGGDDADRQLMIVAGPERADTAGHGHADALSVNVNAGGQALLFDPGTYQYVGINDCERNYFRGTRAHNTLVVDERDQREPKGPFRWASLVDVRAEQWINGETFDLFVGNHNGYKRLAEPVVHRRTVFSHKSGFSLVRDQALGQGKHQLDLYWHVNPELAQTDENKGTFRSAHAGISIVPFENHAWSQEIKSEDWSPAYGRKEAHSVLHFGTVTNLPAEFAVLLLPYAEPNSGASIFQATNSISMTELFAGYGFQFGQDDYHFIFGEGKPWTSSPWSSDADCFVCVQSKDRIRRMLICCNGSYLDSGASKIISSGQKFSRCEIISIEGRIQVFSDGEPVVNGDAFDKGFPEQNGELTGVKPDPLARMERKT